MPITAFLRPPGVRKRPTLRPLNSFSSLAWGGATGADSSRVDDSDPWLKSERFSSAPRRAFEDSTEAARLFKESSSRHFTMYNDEVVKGSDSANVQRHRQIADTALTRARELATQVIAPAFEFLLSN